MPSIRCMAKESPQTAISGASEVRQAGSSTNCDWQALARPTLPLTWLEMRSASSWRSGPPSRSPQAWRPISEQRDGEAGRRGEADDTGRGEVSGTATPGRTSVLAGSFRPGNFKRGNFRPDRFMRRAGISTKYQVRKARAIDSGTIARSRSGDGS